MRHRPVEDALEILVRNTAVRNPLKNQLQGLCRTRIAEIVGNQVEVVSECSAVSGEEHYRGIWRYLLEGCELLRRTGGKCAVGGLEARERQ